MGNSFEVTGGTVLQGELVPQGAKNEALQVICATLLTPEKVIIRNIPDIRDVNKLIELLQHLGVHVEQLGVLKGEFSFEAKNINLDFLETPEFKKQAAALRGSIMIAAPGLSPSRSSQVFWRRASIVSTRLLPGVADFSCRVLTTLPSASTSISF